MYTTRKFHHKQLSIVGWMIPYLNNDELSHQKIANRIPYKCPQHYDMIYSEYVKLTYFWFQHLTSHINMGCKFGKLDIVVSNFKKYYIDI